MKTLYVDISPFIRHRHKPLVKISTYEKGLFGITRKDVIIKTTNGERIITEFLNRKRANVYLGTILQTLTKKYDKVVINNLKEIDRS